MIDLREAAYETEIYHHPRRHLLSGNRSIRQRTAASRERRQAPSGGSLGQPSCGISENIAFIVRDARGQPYKALNSRAFVLTGLLECISRSMHVVCTATLSVAIVRLTRVLRLVLNHR